MLKVQEDLLKKIERQLNMGVNSVAKEDKWMLKVDLLHLAAYLLSDKEYWIHTVKAVQQVSTRAMELLEGMTNSWNNIMKEWALQAPPKPMPIPTDTPTTAAPVGIIRDGYDGKRPLPSVRPYP